MSTFKKTNIKIYSKPAPKVTPDTIYWKNLGVPVLLKEFGPIDYIHFSPVEPHYFALTCSAHVQVYNPVTKQVYKNLSRFREAAYGGTFRSDGQLLCVGGEECHVKLFNVKSKSLLRVFKGHKSAVHRCFFTSDKSHIASFSDDRTVALWDIATEKQIISFSEHKDYVRTGAVSPVSTEIVLSGGYDKTVCMYDTRTNNVVFNIDHGAPVECVMFLPTGGIFLSAGGTEVRVWDALAGGRLLAKLSQHHKTVTCLHLASNNQRIMSGSLDRHVKIYDIATYRVVHTLDYPSAILSIGTSPGDETIAVGMVDGIVSVSQKEKEVISKRQQERKVSYRHISDHVDYSKINVYVSEPVMGLMSKYDHHLRKFEYSKALDSALTSHMMGKIPAATVAVCQELMRRKGLQTALAGREGKSLLSVIRFLSKYVTDSRFAPTLIDVANIFLDIYEGTEAVTSDLAVSRQLSVLAERLRQEEALSSELACLQGALHMLLAGASAVDTSSPSPATIQPSANAQTTTVVDVADEM